MIKVGKIDNGKVIFEDDIEFIATNSETNIDSLYTGRVSISEKDVFDLMPLVAKIQNTEGDDIINIIDDIKHNLNQILKVEGVESIEDISLIIKLMTTILNEAAPSFSKISSSATNGITAKTSKRTTL